jgi:hypothetical protein
MTEVVTDDLVIRAYWPGQQPGEPRASYSLACILLASGCLCAAFVYALLGSPLDTLIGTRFSAVDLFAWALALFVVAIGLGYWFDGTKLIANRERIALKKWFRKPRALAIRELGRIVLCSVDPLWSSWQIRHAPAILFFNHEGRCVMSLYSRFCDEDLTTLWAMIGIKPEGSWSDYVSGFDLKRRFPGAF